MQRGLTGRSPFGSLPVLALLSGSLLAACVLTVLAPAAANADDPVDLNGA